MKRYVWTPPQSLEELTQMNNFKDKYFPVLDNGFVALKDWMGNDQAIVQMARCSYGAGTKAVSTDRGLIRTLMREKHTSPFERCELVVHVGMPIFVARQWIRHRTASVNEYSGRYSVMPMIFYTPAANQCLKQNQTNRQGRGAELAYMCDEAYEDEFIRNTDEVRDSMKNQYADRLNHDLARELARIDLPLSMYTYWYWKIDLHNLLHFLRLRLDPHAQWEIRQYAQVIAGLVKEWCPLTWEAFEDYVLGGVSFSRLEQEVVLEVMRSGDYSLQDPSNVNSISSHSKELGLSDREVAALLKKLAFRPNIIDYSLDLSYAKDPTYFEKLIAANSQLEVAV